MSLSSKPKSRFAPVFQLVVIPLGSMVKIPKSVALSKMSLRSSLSGTPALASPCGALFAFIAFPDP